MNDLTRYLEDKRFIEWVFNSTSELEKWWDSYQMAHQDESENILQARKILNKFKTQDKQLSIEEKIMLFSSILKQVQEKKEKQQKIKRYLSVVKYAAVAVLFFSLGALLFYEQDNSNSQLYTQEITDSYSGDEARLIRPNGENIILNSKKSVVEHHRDGEVVVNNNIHATPETEKNAANEAQLNQLIIPYGKTSEVILPDGTKVFLNAGSRLVYPEYFGEKKREVLLVGEAFFDVTHDEKHPFVVQTTDVRVQVLGTRFNVCAYPAEQTINTVLVDGKVKLEKNITSIFSESVELEPNQLATYDKATQKSSIHKVDVDNYILWKDGLFKFESVDLSRVIKKLERFYNIHFDYEDPTLGVIRISGKLELNENRDEIVNRIAIAASVRITKKTENYYEIEK